MTEGSSCGASFGNVKISDLDFTDDAVIFVEILETLLGALKVLNEESKLLGLWVSWVKTKIQAFNNILDICTSILSVPVCGEDVEVTARFTYLGSDIHVSACCEPEVLRSVNYFQDLFFLKKNKKAKLFLMMLLISLIIALLTCMISFSTEVNVMVMALFFFIPRRVAEGGYCCHPGRPAVRPSVRPSGRQHL